MFNDPTYPLHRLLAPFAGRKIHILCLGRRENIARFRNDVPAIHDKCTIDEIIVAHVDGLGDDTARVWEMVDGKKNDLFDIVFIVDSDLRDILDIHRITVDLKDTGCIVSACYGRPLFYTPPGDGSPIYGYPGIFNLCAKFAAEFQMEGDYLEFGVFDGRTMSLAWQTMGWRMPRMRFVGFDSFAGIRDAMPDEGYVDLDYYSNIETFRHHMICVGADPERILTGKGRFAETLADPKKSHAELGLKSCLIAHIDCDIYQAAKLALDYLTGLLRQGSIILFDEFHYNKASNALGERRALAEWLEKNPQYQVERWHDYALFARAYIVHCSE